MFIDSHDEERFLCSQQDVPLYKNALAFIYFVEGMPIVYYGMEQGMGGNRDPLWHAGYSQDAELYVYITMLNWWVAAGAPLHLFVAAGMVPGAAVMQRCGTSGTVASTGAARSRRGGQVVDVTVTAGDPGAS
jgi:hypothetical protein